MPEKIAISLPIPKVAIGFRPEYLDFKRGIRVGNLEDHERITRILKLALEDRYQQPFVTERYGRGVFWQWIAFLPRANREAKPISNKVSFGCSKYYIYVNTSDRIFESGLQIERGQLKAHPGKSQNCLREDWDWHRLLKSLKPGGPMERQLKRLVLREGFAVAAGGWGQGLETFSKADFPTMRKLRKILQTAPANDWGGFQLYYPITEEEVKGATGVDLVESMLAVFREVTPAMNLTMQIQLSEK